MSTYMYYRCMEHDPSLRSDEEIGQHYRDIPRSQELLKPEIRQLIRDAAKADLEVCGTNLYDPARINFLEQHPDCDIRIFTEYGVDVTDYDPEKD